MTERDDSARRAGESAGLSVSGVETDTQTDAAEVALSPTEREALLCTCARDRGPDRDQHSMLCNTQPGTTQMMQDRRLVATVEHIIAAREAAAEARGAQAVLAAVEEASQRQRWDALETIVDAARAAAAAAGGGGERPGPGEPPDDGLAYGSRTGR